MDPANPRIDKSVLIEELVQEHPELIAPLKEVGITCIRCGEPIWGTLEEAALEKGLADIDDIVEMLNRIIDRKGN